MDVVSICQPLLPLLLLLHASLHSRSLPRFHRGIHLDTTHVSDDAIKSQRKKTKRETRKTNEPVTCHTFETSQMADEDVGRVKPEAKAATRKRTAAVKVDNNEKHGKTNEKMQKIEK